MGNPALDQYMKTLVGSLKGRQFKTGDMKEAFNKAVPKSARQNLFFLNVCYAFSLLLGVDITLFAIGGSMFVQFSIINYVLLFIGMLGFASLAYFSFSSFGIKERTVLILTGSLSLVMSFISIVISVVIANLTKGLEDQVAAIAEGGAAFGMMSMFADPINPFALVAIIILSYNLLPVVFLLIKE